MFLESKGKGACAVKRFLILGAGWLIILTMVSRATAQAQFGENWHINSGAQVSVGYEADYGDQTPSNHGLEVGANGTVNGYYYDPNFINFSVSPYYNQSRTDSSYQSLTDASGVAATANLFTGSHFPGSVSYRYDYNSTGELGLVNTPNFTTQGNAQGFGVGWSALFAGWPTLSASYQQGSGSGTLYGTDEKTSASNRTFNLHSNYNLSGFLLNAYYDRTTYNSMLPEFLTGETASNTTASNTNDSSGNDFGFSASRRLPLNGQFYGNFNRSDISSNYFSTAGETGTTNTSFTTDIETAGANFHPTNKLGFSADETFVSNLSGYLNQGLINNGSGVAPVNLGAGSHSFTVGGGASYTFTDNIAGSAQATYYDQSYYGQSFTGTYLSGTVYYNKRLWDMFTFWASVVDSSSQFGNNSVGFIGNVNFFKRFGSWETGGNFNYAQNVQSVLITYTTSYYSYTANLHRRLGRGWQWTAAFNGNHSGLSNQPGSSYHTEGYSSTLSLGRLALNGYYVNSSGNSLAVGGVIVPLPPTPGLPSSDLIQFTSSSYGGGFSYTPLRRLVFTGSYSRALSNTLNNSIFSRNNTEIYYSQMQYNVRRIGVIAGYSRFTQGISALGVLPGTVNSYYFGISRWFNFF